MAATLLKTREDIEDFVRGGTFYGAGGSCLPERAVNSLMKALEQGYEIGWIEAQDLPRDACVFSAFAMGSTAMRDEAAYAQMQALGLTEENELLDINDQLQRAIEELSAFAPAPLAACIAPEVSDSSTAAALVGAATRGLKAVDGSYVTRAVPAATLSTFHFEGKRMTPMASCDGWGNVCIIKETINGQLAEKLGKLVSEAGFGLVGMAGLLLDVAELPQVLIPGILTRCLTLGKALRVARDSEGDAFANIVSATGGYEICRGIITRIEDKSEGGYYWGHVQVDCNGCYFSYWFKNENFVVWREGEPYVTGPDIITAIDLETFEPIANQASYVGQAIALIGVPVDAAMRRGEIYDALAPRAFGFDFDHTPIEEVMRRTAPHREL